jgi:hypothetical protein
MHDPSRHPCQAPQTLLLIQITHQRRNALRAQNSDTIRVGSQRNQANLAIKCSGNAHTDITAAHDENSLTAKSGRQGT